jgi:peptidoglycan/xylan/chitin deacetylase (PgdA/CDA1 family)
MGIGLLLLLSVVIVVVIILLAYYPPHVLMNEIQHRFPGVLFHYENPKTRTIALTIDDSPTCNTADIIRILNDNECTATFFVIGGFVLKNDPDKQIIDILKQSGHELGNHTMKDRATIKLTQQELEEELQCTHDIIKRDDDDDNTNNVEWFRPGSGWFSLNMVKTAKKFGYKTVLGSVYPHDPIVRWSSVNLWYILNKVQPGDIIIIHDRPWTIPLLKQLLPELRKRNYNVVSLSKFMKLC